MKKIIWISSYPKSGNTFLRILLSSYFYSNDGIYNQNLLEKIPEFPRDFFDFQINNSFDNEVKHWKSKLEKISNKNTNYTFLKTHSANLLVDKKYRTIPNENTLCIIYIYRDPRNIVLSLKDHFNNSLDENIEFLFNKKNILRMSKSEFAKGFAPILDWEDNYKSYSLNQEKIKTLFVKYENLVKNTEKVFEEILEFLKGFIDVKIDKEKILKTIKSTKFENLKKIEYEEGFIEKKIMGIKNNPNPFFNKGKDRNFNNDLPINLIDKIEEKYFKTMKETGYLKN